MCTCEEHVWPYSLPSGILQGDGLCHLHIPQFSHWGWRSHTANLQSTTESSKLSTFKLVWPKQHIIQAPQT